MASVLSLKVFLISTAVLFTALGLNVSVPLVTDFFSTHVPLTWNFCHLCFNPPFLFLITNAIIITIAASSRFHHRPEPTPPPEFTVSLPPPLDEISTGDGVESTWTSPEITPPEHLSPAEKPHETLEDAWKAITEGRGGRHVRKFDTWEDPVEATRVSVKKSETFKERRSPVAKMRKEAWLSQDELNRRVEGFIRKFNEEMRLQRQQYP